MICCVYPTNSAGQIHWNPRGSIYVSAYNYSTKVPRRSQQKNRKQLHSFLRVGIIILACKRLQNVRLRAMNIYDVSKHAGVSIATVSRVLNGNPNVSEKTRNKVLSVMVRAWLYPERVRPGAGFKYHADHRNHVLGFLGPVPGKRHLLLRARPAQLRVRLEFSAAPATTWTPSRSISTCFAPSGWTRSSWPAPSSWRCGPRTTPT